MKHVVKEFELRYYERSKNYMVRCPGEGYLKYMENTGAVIAVKKSEDATYMSKKNDAKELIDYYIKGTPIKTETLRYVVEE